MGSVVKAIGSVLGFGPGAKAPAPNVKPAIDEVKAEADKAKLARSALIQNAAGQAGAQLSPGQVGVTKDTLLGN